MKNYIILLLILLLSGCSSTPEIIRKMVPVEDENFRIDDIIVEAERDNVIVTIRYMDKIELHEIAKENSSSYIDDDAPLLTTFRITIQNNRKSKIIFNIQNTVLLDGRGNQYQVLTMDAFRDLYSSTVYQHHEYSFVFDGYTKEPYFPDDYQKRKKAKKTVKTLFKGGSIYPGVTVKGILPFERLTAYAIDITLILSDIKLYKEDYDTDKESKNKEEKIIEMQFKFKQKVERLKK